jgi:hypothetical protein
LKEIKLNSFQLNVLFGEQEKEDYQYILKYGIYCSKCEEICMRGVDINAHYLNSLNDILIKGTCKVCGNPVNRFIEFGDDKEFYERAMNFRRSIGEEL